MTLRNDDNIIFKNAIQGIKLDDVFILDAHGHLDLWKSANATKDECSPEGMIRNMDRVGIDILCINRWNHPGIDSNKAVADAIKKYPDRFIGFAVAFPAFGAGFIREEFKRCFEEHGFRGIKVHVSYTMLPMRSSTALPEHRKAMEAVWEFAALKKYPVLCHGYLNPEIAKRYPEAYFLSAHAGGSRQTAHDYADCPNIFLDTASSSLIRGNICYQEKVVGSERIVYGSDMPYANPALRLAQLISEKLTEKSLRNILGLNMAGILDINIPERYKK